MLSANYVPVTGMASNRLVVDCNRRDRYKPDGTPARPFKRLADAFAAAGSARSAAEFQDEANAHWLFQVNPGIYADEPDPLQVPIWAAVTLLLDQAEIRTNVRREWLKDFTPITGETFRFPSLAIRGTSFRAAYAGHPLCGIRGDLVLYTEPGIGGVTDVHMIQSGLLGKVIQEGAGSSQRKFFTAYSSIEGYEGRASGNDLIYAYNCDTSSSVHLGDVSGTVCLYRLRNVRMSQCMAVSSVGGELRNVQMGTTSDLTAYTGALTIDAATYSMGKAVWDARIAAGGTTNFEDKAEGVAFAPAVAGDWNAAPSRVQAALDELAARIKAIEGP